MNVFNAPFDTDYWMSQNGFYCGFNLPEALKGEEAHRLPPYARRKAFLVDDYAAVPKEWMHSEGKLASYFVAIKEGFGMWLDFNKNQENTYEVAVLISVQGVNPITGLPCTDSKLEQYIDCCPKCNEKFHANRYCPKCEMKWPKQNYISTTGQSAGQLWLDGFKTAEGVVRQYLFTKEEARGVAGNIVGEDKVYAVGISFFLSKTPKPVQKSKVLRSLDSNQYLSKGLANNTAMPGLNSGWQNCVSDYHSETAIKGAPQFFGPIHTPLNWQIPTAADVDAARNMLGTTCNDPNLEITSSHSFDLNWDSANATMDCMECTEVKLDKVEVGAGAKIEQEVYPDPQPLDFWRDEPESIIVINYATEECIKKILDAGKTNKKTKQEGFLQGIPVGN